MTQSPKRNRRGCLGTEATERESTLGIDLVERRDDRLTNGSNVVLRKIMVETTDDNTSSNVLDGGLLGEESTETQLSGRGSGREGREENGTELHG